jgi:hypothetical protein
MKEMGKGRSGLRMGREVEGGGGGEETENGKVEE